MTFIFVSNSAPITANAATVKKVGVGKTITYNAKATVKSVKSSKKGIVKATKKGKKVTIKGVKAGTTTVTVKTAKKTVKLNVKVGATKIAKKTLKTTMTAGTSQTVSVTATGGKGDTIKFASSNKAVLTVNKASAKASTKGIAKMGVKAVKEGTATLTVSSKNTGVKKAFKITVKAAAPAATNAPTVATTPGITTPTATVAATKAPSVATTPAVQTTAPTTTDTAATENPDATKDPNATEVPSVTTTPAVQTEAPTGTDAVSTEAPATEAPATEAPASTETPSVPTGGAVTEAGLKISAVTRVSTTGVNVEFSPVTEAMKDVTIKVVDDNGNVLEVYAKDLVKGDSNVTFKFKKSFTDIEQIKGIWYVNDVAYDVVEVNALSSVYTGTANQVDLLKALNALKLVDVIESNAALYEEAAAELSETYSSSSQLTVSIVQNMVNEVNKKAVTESDCIKAIKGVKDSRNQVALLEALQTPGVFERVNPDWIADYETQLATYKGITLANNFVVADELEAIQDEINLVNEAYITTKSPEYLGGTPGVYALDADKITGFVGIVTKYMIPDTTTTSDKATLLAKLETQLAICKVVSAETPAQLSLAINALKSRDDAYELDMENFIEDNRGDYIKAIAAATAANKDTVDEINTILESVNEKVALKPIQEVVRLSQTAGAADKADTEAVYKALTKVAGLKNLAKENAGFYASCADATATYGVADGTHGTSRSAAATNILLLDVSTTGGNTPASVEVLTMQLQRIIDVANLQAVMAQAAQGTVDEDKLYTALVNYGNGIKDLSSENKAFYAAAAIVSTYSAPTVMSAPANTNDTDYANASTIKTYKAALDGNLKTDVDALQLVIDAANVDAVQSTTTAEAMLAKLNIITRLDNVKPENAKEYFKGYVAAPGPGTGIYAPTVAKVLGSSSTDTTALDVVINGINNQVTMAKYVKALNNAKTAEEVRTALTNIALEFDGKDNGNGVAGNANYSKYINLSNADKLLVAAMFMNDDTFATDGLVSAGRNSVASFGGYDDVTAPGDTIDDEITKDLDAIIDEINDGSAGSLIYDINALFPADTTYPSITSVQTELAKLVKTGYKAYDKLTAAQKLEVAEAFITAYPVDKDGKHILNSYKSLSAYEAAVDAAIASVVK